MVDTVRIFDDRQEWYRDGLCHRDNDEPAIVFNDGKRAWLYHGKRHRCHGPAIDFRNDAWWFLYGKHHRIGSRLFALIDCWCIRNVEIRRK